MYRVRIGPLFASLVVTIGVTAASASQGSCVHDPTPGPPPEGPLVACQITDDEIPVTVTNPVRHWYRLVWLRVVAEATRFARVATQRS